MKALREVVGAVVEVLGRFANPLPGVCPKIATAIESLRRGSDGNSGETGHVVNRCPRRPTRRSRDLAPCAVVGVPAHGTVLGTGRPAFLSCVWFALT